MTNEQKRDAKYRLAKAWVQNRPWMRFDIETYGYEHQNGKDARKTRVRLQFKRRDGAWITVREHIGFSIKRSMVKTIENLQGRELTLSDVELRR